MGQYTRAEGGQGRKPKLREERRNERHKSSENAQEKWNYQCEKGADLNSRPFSKMVSGNVRTGQNSLKLVHFLLKKGHDRKKDHKWNNAIYQDDFCVRNCELLSRRFFKSPKLIYILRIPQTFPLFRLRPLWASASHSWGGHGHLLSGGNVCAKLGFLKEMSKK